MSRKAQGSPSLQSIKSLPVDFEFKGDPGSDGMTSSDTISENDVSMDASQGTNNGDDDVGFTNHESPYIGMDTSAKDLAKDEAADEDAGEATLGDGTDDHKEKYTSMQLHEQSPDESKWSDATSTLGDGTDDHKEKYTSMQLHDQSPAESKWSDATSTLGDGIDDHKEKYTSMQLYERSPAESKWSDATSTLDDGTDDHKEKYTSMQLHEQSPAESKWSDANSTLGDGTDDHKEKYTSMQVHEQSPAESKWSDANSTLGDGTDDHKEKHTSMQLHEQSPAESKWSDANSTLGDGTDDHKEKYTSMQLHEQSRAESKWSDATSDTSKKKLYSWFQLPDGNWELATIIKTIGNQSLISYSEGKVLKVDSQILLPANPDILDGVDDLMQLSYLNEPSVLYNLQYRHNQDMIYTKAGPVLVAINPFKEVPLYGNDYIEAYRCKSMDKPHVYGITDTAMREMIRDEVNQSIIISGESGAGKTETAKIAMQYLAALGGGSGIEYEILKTNPILEAFGNAKTLRNDNSSRFGKLIEIHFSETGKIAGANIQTFLLEKSRVVQCSDGERSYHIFYQLCAGAPPSLRDKLKLKNVDEFNYLRQSNCYSISGVDDAKQFLIVMEALDIVHVKKEDQESVFAMLAAVLWLGNVSFTVVDGENHVEPVVDEGLINVATLIGCKVEELQRALSTRKMRVGKRNDTIVQKLTLAQAIDTRDALAKSIYSCLFDWLVEQINKSLAVGKRRTGRSISILDIYGFESFERNGFEQFCINYANERLQQHFNRHLFKLEQEEYIQDGIDWAKVDFEDNQDCLNLFEKKPLGLQSLLDEESTFPNGTDLSFADKLKQHLHSNPCFRGGRGETFAVRHYAGEVTYDATGFLEKNRDLLHLDSIELLSSCACHLPQNFASTMLTQPEKLIVGALHRSGGADSQKLSVMTKFKGQLFQLMKRLENTTSHFIRCIKPNDTQCPGSYNQGLILQQLRCCGVLEVVRISRSGFPTRMTHQKFARRYGFLLSEYVASKDPLSVSVAILNQFNILPEMYQVGYTKLFFRTGQIGLLEDTRNRTLYGILRVQSCFRGHQARCLVKEMKAGIAFLQSFVRAEKTRKEYAILLRDHRAAISIQKHVKARVVRHGFKRLNEASTAIQSVIRGWLVRRCSGEIGLLQFLRKGNQPEEVLVNSSYLAELQRRVLRAETSLREKEEENDILLQRLQEYDDRWSEYELRMKSMEEVWQKQMRSLQSSLSIARKSFPFDDSHRNSDSVNGNDESESSWDPSSHLRPHESNGGRSAGPSLSVIHRLAEEFEERSQVFGDDARFLVEVKSGQVEASLDPDQELRRLKQMFEAWKKDYGARLRETKVILHKLGNGEGQADKARKKWWGRRNSSRIN